MLAGNIQRPNTPPTTLKRLLYITRFKSKSLKYVKSSSDLKSDAGNIYAVFIRAIHLD
jgi:hypothetical protein